MPALHFDQALLREGWARDVRVVVADGRIASVTPGAEPASGDERHAIGLPGMPNVHSHAFQRAMAGRAEIRGTATDTFWTWREAMYRTALAVSPDEVEAIAAFLYVEMLEAGFTRVGEFHYLHHDPQGRPYADIGEMAARIAAAATATGISLTLLPTFYAHGGFGGAAPTAGQRRFICDLDGFARLMERSRHHLASLEGAVLGVAPHSLRAVTDSELPRVVPLAGGGPVHIHAAEQTKEVEDCRAWSGQPPVEWLLDHTDADRHWCFIHATHMTDAGTRRMAERGVTAGLCPITEANLGDGIFNGPEFAAAGGSYAIGSDSNVLIGVADELRQLEYSQRLRLRARNVMAGISPPRDREGSGVGSRGECAGSTGRALYDAALVGGNRALGVEASGLVAGAFADIVSLDATDVGLAATSADAILDAWIFASRQNLVDCVWSRGRKIVAGGRHIARDAIEERFRATLVRL